MALVEDSVVVVAISYRLDGQGLNLCGGVVFHNHPEWFSSQPDPYSVDTGSFPGGKWLRCDFNHTNNCRG